MERVVKRRKAASADDEEIQYRIQCEDCRMQAKRIGRVSPERQQEREENDRNTPSLYVRYFMKKKHKFEDPMKKLKY